MGKHLQFLTQMAMNSQIFKLLYKNYHNHYKVWLNRWLKKWTNRSNKNRSWRINRGGIFRKNTFISKNTPFKIGVLSEKTYNFAPSTDKK